MRYITPGARTPLLRTPRLTVPRLEELESRITPYVTSGGAWVNPQLITISFVPDGTVLGYNGLGQALTSTLFHDFAALGSTSTWQTPILKAAQVWAQATNINFSVVSDDGVALGSGPDQQGDPNHGDIRIGGYQMGTLLEPLAFTYLPPQLNNYDIAGDVTFNTSEPFNIGSTYDLFTVAAHEIGHSLGLSESLNPTAIEWPVYNGTFTALASDDISGIQAIYGTGRGAGVNDHTFATAQTVTINTSTLTAQVTTGNLVSLTDVDYYEFTVPSGSASTATISVQSAGLSLLSPKVYVYNAAHTQIAFANGNDEYGTTLTVTPSISAGSTYFVKVMGANTTAFGVGDYALTINTGTGTSPAVPIPNTTTPDGNPEQSIGGEADLPSGAVPLLFTGDPAALARATAVANGATPTPAALAIGLAQTDAGSVQEVIVGPATTASDLNFQALPYQGPHTFTPRLMAAWPDYGDGGTATADSVFLDLTAPDADE